MIKIKVLGGDIEIETGAGEIFSLTRKSLDDLHKAIELIQELPKTKTFFVLEIKLD